MKSSIGERGGSKFEMMNLKVYFFLQTWSILWNLALQMAASICQWVYQFGPDSSVGTTAG